MDDCSRINSILPAILSSHSGSAADRLLPICDVRGQGVRVTTGINWFPATRKVALRTTKNRSRRTRG
jgi:hypothetical protein